MILRYLVMVFLLGVLPAGLTAAPGESDEPATNGSVTAHPNRPSVSDSPEVLPPGLFQLEYGWTHSKLDADHDDDALGSLFRFGVAPGLELRFGWDNFVRESEPLSVHKGVGDSLLGAQYQFNHESSRMPVLAFGYGAKLPTADSSLGSGEVDHAFALLLGKTFGKTVFDVNAVYRMAGREAEPGFDSNKTLIITVARPLKGPVGIIGEVLGESGLNTKHEAFATALVALTFKLTPRLVLDAGIEAGFTPHAPDRHLVFGFTYAFGNLYPAGRQSHGPRH